MNADPHCAPPWYRDRWPWILISGPLAAVIAGAITTWIAFSGADGLVVKDYYKQGLAVNRMLEREATAGRMGLVAQVEFAADRHRIAVDLAGAQPAELRVHLAHRTRGGHDLALRLARVGEARYEGAVPAALPAGGWSVRIEDPEGIWRLAGDWSGREDAFALGAPGRAVN